MSDQSTDPAAGRDSVSRVSLGIPCRAEHVSLCRLVVGALGARDGLDEDAVADLKVIVTEACNCFLAIAADSQAGRSSLGPTCSIRLDFDSRPGAFVVGVLYPEKRGLVSWLEGRDPMSEAGLGLTILRALADEMAEVDDPAGTILRLTKRLPA